MSEPGIQPRRIDLSSVEYMEAQRKADAERHLEAERRVAEQNAQVELLNAVRQAEAGRAEAERHALAEQHFRLESEAEANRLRNAFRRLSIKHSATNRSIIAYVLCLFGLPLLLGLHWLAVGRKFLTLLHIAMLISLIIASNFTIHGTIRPEPPTWTVAVTVVWFFCIIIGLFFIPYNAYKASERHYRTKEERIAHKEAQNNMYNGYNHPAPPPR